MKLVERRWLSWTIRAVLYLPPALIFLWLLSLPWQLDRSHRRTRQEVEQRYHELVAAGKLEQPSEGFSAVTISSRHGGPPYVVRFWQDDPKRNTSRYYVYWGESPQGEVVWKFQDVETKKEVY